MLNFPDFFTTYAGIEKTAEIDRYVCTLLLCEQESGKSTNFSALG